MNGLTVKDRRMAREGKHLFLYPIHTIVIYSSVPHQRVLAGRISPSCLPTISAMHQGKGESEETKNALRDKRKPSLSRGQLKIILPEIRRFSLVVGHWQSRDTSVCIPCLTLKLVATDWQSLSRCSHADMLSARRPGLQRLARYLIISATFDRL